MSAVERRIVHEALKDDPEVDDGERGRRAEPLRRRGSRGTPSTDASCMSHGRARPLARSRRRDAGPDGAARPGRGAPRAARRRAARRPARRARARRRSSTSARAAARPGSRSPRRFPDRRVTLLEAERRKCDFLERWTAELPNLDVVWGRAEEQPLETYRRRGREGARAAAGRGRVVPAARPRGRRGVLWVGPSADPSSRVRTVAGSARRPSSRQAPDGLRSCCARRADAARLPAPPGHARGSARSR